jgi:hypothetical protein
MAAPQQLPRGVLRAAAAAALQLWAGNPAVFVRDVTPAEAAEAAKQRSSALAAVPQHQQLYASTQRAFEARLLYSRVLRVVAAGGQCERCALSFCRFAGAVRRGSSVVGVIVEQALK